jgi:hypothetical protein
MLGRKYSLDDTEPPASEHIEKLKGVVEDFGLEVGILH